VFLFTYIPMFAAGEGFIVAASGTAGESNLLVKFSTEGKVLQTTPLDDLLDNVAYDPVHRLVYFCGIDGDASFVSSYHADTLKLSGRVSISNDRALLDLQYDRVTNTLLALTSDTKDRFIVASVNVTSGKITTLATLPELMISVSENSEAYDDVNGVYYIAALYQTGASGWLPAFTRTGHVGPLLNVSDWVQNTIWNEARQSLCGTWTDDSSIACTNVSSAETDVFSPALNFSAHGFRLLGASAFDPSTQSYFSVFETHKPLVSWVKADMNVLSPFAVGIDKYFVETMVFVPTAERTDRQR